MRVLGLDLSLTSTGYAVLEWQTLEHPGLRDWACVNHGTIRSPKVGPERLAQISAEIGRIAYGTGFTPVDAVYVEDYAFSRHDAHSHATGELHGVVLTDLWRAGMPTHKVGITTWRKRVLGRGNIAKGDVPLEMYKRYLIEFKTIDTTEAFGVAMWAYLEATGQNKPAAGRRQKVAS